MFISVSNVGDYFSIFFLSGFGFCKIESGIRLLKSYRQYTRSSQQVISSCHTPIFSSSLRQSGEHPPSECPSVIVRDNVESTEGSATSSSISRKVTRVAPPIIKQVEGSNSRLWRVSISRVDVILLNRRKVVLFCASIAEELCIKSSHCQIRSEYVQSAKFNPPIQGLCCKRQIQLLSSVKRSD